MDDRTGNISISENYLGDESTLLNKLVPLAQLDPATNKNVRATALRLVDSVRTTPEYQTPLEHFLSEYDLGSEEGVLLMCLAESLLRVPDTNTADILIADKIKLADWERHIGNNDFMVNASTWGLMLTGRFLPDLDQQHSTTTQHWQHLLARLGEPIIRQSINLAMRIISEQFVMGTTIEKAIHRAGRTRHPFECFSFDMLGEAALTAREAERYLAAYKHAIVTVAGNDDGVQSNSVSVKLSALSPRFEINQWQRAWRELTDRLKSLAMLAREHSVPLTVDAEETERLELTLAVFGTVYADPALKDWDELGIAVQAYQKRAPEVIAWLAQQAQQQGKSIPVRLVKGAYWDNEIKQAQIKGLADYPVYTLKRNTDVSYLACVQTLRKYKGLLLPQFATHNAHTVAYVSHCFKHDECEFQRLHGMGESLYAAVNNNSDDPWRCRVYAPVGGYDTLLPYLIRRLLENGANTSFVHRIADPSVPVEEIVADPLQLAQQPGAVHRHSAIPIPPDLYGESRRNSSGINFADHSRLEQVLKAIHQHTDNTYTACPVVNGVTHDQYGDIHDVTNPADPARVIGQVRYVDDTLIDNAIEQATAAFKEWDATAADERATILERAADLLEEHQYRLMALCTIEAGKTISDAHNEVREAVDFLRYYATECRRLFVVEQELPGPVGESNSLRLRGRGVFACISPWNFPIAIYTGQIAAALVSGNTVLAKPAEQSSLIAMAVTELLYQAGVPQQVLHFLPGDGEKVAARVLVDSRIAGVAFTGSGATAKSIQTRLVDKPGAIAALIAETGGINAMLVDSSALPEQVVQDVIHSAFNSAGQRCSALRVLYLQEDIADDITDLIVGRMQELVPGNPLEFETDIGPVIDKEAFDRLQDYIVNAKTEGRLLYQLPVPSTVQNGLFIGPALIRIEHINNLPGEVFGPVLHVIRYPADQLDAICNQINDSGYGLTFAIHSRITHRAEAVCRKSRAGNVYINRNMIGAVVGVQPFGGCGLSGTGPKAGGEHYLARFATEQSISVNTAAVGGNASLLSME